MNLLVTKYGYKTSLSEYVRKATLDRVALMEGGRQVNEWLTELAEAEEDPEAAKTILSDLEWFKARFSGTPRW